MTPRQEEARRLALSGLLNTEIAVQMGISRQGVHNLLKATGTPSNRHPKPDAEQIVTLYQQGLTDGDIAQETGWCKATVQYTRYRAGTRGRIGGQPVLVPCEVERLCRLAREGWTQIELATEFGVNQTLISKTLIKHGLRRQTKRTTKQ